MYIQRDTYPIHTYLRRDVDVALDNAQVLELSLEYTYLKAQHIRTKEFFAKCILDTHK